MVMQVAGVMGMVMCFIGFLLTSPATDFLVRKISEAHGRNPSDMFALKFNMYNIVRDFCLVAFVAFGIVYAMGKMTMKAVKKQEAKYTRKSFQKNYFSGLIVVALHYFIINKLSEFHGLFNKCYCDHSKGGRHLQEMQDPFWSHEAFTFDSKIDGQTMHFQMELPNEEEINSMINDMDEMMNEFERQGPFAAGPPMRFRNQGPKPEFRKPKHHEREDQNDDPRDFAYRLAANKYWDQAKDAYKNETPEQRREIIKNWCIGIMLVSYTLFVFSYAAQHYWHMHSHAQHLDTIVYLKQLLKNAEAKRVSAAAQASNDEDMRPSCPVTDAFIRGEPKAKKFIQNQIEQVKKASINIAPQVAAPIVNLSQVEELDDELREPLLEYQMEEPIIEEQPYGGITKVNNQME